MKQIATALLKAQQEMVNPKKANTNPFFKNKYAGLNEVLDAVVSVLNNNGIVVLQPMVHLDNKNFVKTVLMHESGEMLESFTEIIYNKQNDAQAQGSGITYARRYGLQSFVSVGAEDDDGNSASKTDVKTLPDQKNAEPVIDKARLQARLDACNTEEELKKVWLGFTAMEKTAMEIEKETKKQQLTKKSA